MAVVRILDRIQDQVQAILESRSSPEDTVEWDAVIVPVDEVYGEDDGEDWHTHRQSMLSLFASLACPEVEARSTAHIVVPLYLCEEAALDEWVNQVWDSLVLNRMSASVEGLDECVCDTDPEDGPDTGG